MKRPAKFSERQSQLGLFGTSLRVRVALGVALPVLVLLSSLIGIGYWREHRLLAGQIRLTALELGEVMRGSLRHAMLVNDREMVVNILEDIGRMENIKQVQIINLEREVCMASWSRDLGRIRQFDDPGCRECHHLPADSMPNTVNLSAATGVLRVATLLQNEQDCIVCHDETDETSGHLGVLLADVSLVDIERHLLNDLRVDVMFSLGVTVLLTLVVYLLINRLVVQRVEAFQNPVAEFAKGDFSSRLPVSSVSGDVLDKLANAFNHMADELERHAREREERAKVRQRAIVEERERIAQELHDGLAQLLGYVNTKAMAVRLMLQKNQKEAADRHLLQLEEAARTLFFDVREAILDLKMTGQDGASLTTILRDFAAQFGRLSGLPVSLELAPSLDSLALTAETELQLLRIVQESLTNARKHASATKVWVSIQVSNGALNLQVGDDGKGFDPRQFRTSQRPHLGLSSMRERAEAIGAEFSLDSAPGAGTRVVVRLSLEEE